MKWLLYEIKSYVKITPGAINSVMDDPLLP